MRCLQFEKHVTLVLSWQNDHNPLHVEIINKNWYCAWKKKRNPYSTYIFSFSHQNQKSELPFDIPGLYQSNHPLVCPLPHYQTVRLTPAQIERLVSCVARTSSQCSRVLGISSSGSGSARVPSLGVATTKGSGVRCAWNSTTWSFFLSASAWWVSCRKE